MTEAEIQERRVPEIRPSQSVEVARERTFEELMKEVDDMQAHMDDLEEVRQTIRRCKVGIDNHSRSTMQLKGTLESLETQLKPYSEEAEVKKRSLLPPVNPHAFRMAELKKTTDLAALD